MPKRQPEPLAAALVPEALCPLCGRVLGTANIDRHHLVPKTFKGKEIRSFIDWVAKTPSGFYTRADTSNKKNQR